ncbi:hypothetical protein HBI56_140540 [Parastagonospora nodorum]|nr:hypothetical protein HBH53_117550 [Parastagonospora nodorum]KAH4116107.1 hypothetical protein HBH47_171330 [Parastagonospora nodorum]KAH4345075.1 hypothetical protein HBH98_123530 [Parastagonospora nodorum]KAH4374834.1 hypothetical protein HBH97_120680 [Parastagonospora nodorum]KAH4394598.1 hypothetical protein HBH99_138000 [Parastagonospora nodorum]
MKCAAHASLLRRWAAVSRSSRGVAVCGMLIPLYKYPATQVFIWTSIASLRINKCSMSTLCKPRELNIIETETLKPPLSERLTT